MKHDKKIDEKAFPFKKAVKGKAEKESHADKKMPKKAVKKVAKKGK